MLEKYLQDLGLTDKEAVVYLALLQVDGATALDLSKKTKINRSTVYVVIESLSKKGLVSETTVGKKTQFQAESPERLETYVERRKAQFEEQSHRLKDIIPEIKSLQRDTGERPIVKYFDGVEGIIASAEELFRDEKGSEDEPVYMMYSRDALEGLFSKEDRTKFANMRKGKKIYSKSIYSYDKGEIPSDDTGERVKINSREYPITCDVAIYKDKVRVSVMSKKLSSIFIRSQDVADTLKSLFKLAFESLKK